jgi:hypothetical protein
MCAQVEHVGRLSYRFYVCDRADDHPDGPFVDDPGHHWIPATPEQWAAAMRWWLDSAHAASRHQANPVGMV